MGFAFRTAREVRFGRGEAGRAAEKRLRQLVRGSGMRMVGPNCMGVLNADPAVSLNATFARSLPPSSRASRPSRVPSSVPPK